MKYRGRNQKDFKQGTYQYAYTDLDADGSVVATLQRTSRSGWWTGAAGATRGTGGLSISLQLELFVSLDGTTWYAVSNQTSTDLGGAFAIKTLCSAFPYIRGKAILGGTGGVAPKVRVSIGEMV